jgi:hypothetical protein
MTYYFNYASWRTNIYEYIQLEKTGVQAVFSTNSL